MCIRDRSKSGNPDIYLYDLNSSNWIQLTTHFGIDTEPDWSPNSKKLIFTSNRSGSPQIYELNVNNKRIKRLTFEGTYNARGRYLPDGKNIVFVHRKNGIFHIATQNIRTGKVRVLTNTFWMNHRLYHLMEMSFFMPRKMVTRIFLQELPWMEKQDLGCHL